MTKYVIVSVAENEVVRGESLYYPITIWVFVIINFVLGGLSIFADARAYETSKRKDVEKKVTIRVERVRGFSRSIDLNENCIIQWGALISDIFLFDQIVDDDPRHVVPVRHVGRRFVTA